MGKQRDLAPNDSKLLCWSKAIESSHERLLSTTPKVSGRSLKLTQKEQIPTFRPHISGAQNFFKDLYSFGIRFSLTFKKDNVSVCTSFGQILILHREQIFKIKFPTLTD